MKRNTVEKTAQAKN